MRIRKDKDFISFFDEKTGMYLRTGIIKHGRDTGIDPFMSSFPELLDVGIMGHCSHGQKGLCLRAGIECYQNGPYRSDPNMALEDFKSIATQCRGKTYQIALGGCGDPDQHEHSHEILQLCRSNEIVPNFTTSGLGVTPKLARLCRQYCGAVAISWYRSSYTLEAVHTLLNEGVRTNIHYVLNTDTVEEALRLLELHQFPKEINAVIFLLHKPIGLGTQEKVIAPENALFQKLIKVISQLKLPYKIGFDSCTVPALVNHPGNIGMESLDTCEGARWSAYISPDMKMMPCSFDNQEQKWAVDLRHFSIMEAWNSNEFENFRSRLRSACPGCPDHFLCLGGCPICPEVVLCSRKEREPHSA